ncbi:MAG TPA: bifunctional phosphoribosylaminoimidazolecarboxamide formyltransferase/IMP cyclohydrolase [Gammaproteobacteria bacterium]|nr:bifunctional phosphoribosylaminoimidazolecarboxamide formyltransferase/IMP cyclohydrolase [Gammaproteobacteria bacterium]
MAQTKRALISVSDKSGVTELARGLAELGIEIVSTGGTAALLRKAGIEVREVADLTGFPEIMDGRIKTLHPRVHGGLLGRRGTDEAVMSEHGIEPIDLLVVNLYPFREAVADPECTPEQAVEQIDIGGPAMLRAAAKNHDAVTVLVESSDYPLVLMALRAAGEVPYEARVKLASKAFAHVASYDSAIAHWLGWRSEMEGAEMPADLVLPTRKIMDLRYGENPQQRAAVYTPGMPRKGTMGAARQLQGKALSYNNLLDGDTALECVKYFDEPACVIVKHANPCGVATADNILDAYRRAYATDPVSAFGGIIAFNRPLDGATAEAILKRQFVEVLIAPSLEPDAKEALSRKPNVRALASGRWSQSPLGTIQLRSIAGALLVQDTDDAAPDPAHHRVVSERRPSQHELDDLLFAWKVVRFVKSNAIVFCKDAATIGVGAGQMSRIYSTRIAAIKAADAGLAIKGSVMASDAFFPFRDNVDTAAEMGVTAIIQPGGSMRDEEVIRAADEHGLAMVFTGVRHFRH